MDEPPEGHLGLLSQLNERDRRSVSLRFVLEGAEPSPSRRSVGTINVSRERCGSSSKAIMKLRLLELPAGA